MNDQWKKKSRKKKICKCDPSCIVCSELLFCIALKPVMLACNVLNNKYQESLKEDGQILADKFYCVSKMKDSYMNGRP